MIPFQSNTHILLVDDDPLLNELLTDILELAGARVSVATSGNTAWNFLQAIVPEMIICDVMMDDGDGFDLLKRVRGNTRTTHLPFIFLSAKAEPNDFRTGMDLGADDFLTKPVSKGALIKAIQMRLSRAGSAHPMQPVASAKWNRGAMLVDQLRKELDRLHAILLASEQTVPVKPASASVLQSLLESHGRLAITSEALQDFFGTEADRTPHLPPQ